MAETLNVILEERRGIGQEKYVDSMELSADAKAAEVLPWVKPGLIVDAGAGAGPLTERLSKRFPESKIIAVDLSADMVRRLGQRFSGNEKIEIVRSDVEDFHYRLPVDTVIFASCLHEVFSFGGYSHEEVIKALANAHEIMGGGGRLIIRDGVQPEPEMFYVKPLNPWAFDRFNKFVEGFKKVRTVNYTVGRFHQDTFVQGRRNGYSDFENNNGLIEINSQDASEMLSKYFYPEENLPVELSEQFGIWSLREYQKILLEVGFAIKHAETGVLPFLLEQHYSHDFEFYHLVDGVLSNAPYPPSRMLLVGEK